MKQDYTMIGNYFSKKGIKKPYFKNDQELLEFTKFFKADNPMLFRILVYIYFKSKERGGRLYEDSEDYDS